MPHHGPMSNPAGQHQGVVVKESSLKREGLYGVLTLAFLAALIRGVTGAMTTGGRITAGILFGALAAVVAFRWFWAVRHPGRLEVSSNTVRFIPGSGKIATQEISRSAGDQLQFVARGTARYVSLALRQSASGTVVSMGMFDRKPVQRACEASGWRFGSAG